jgi:hypothetical protein
MRSASPSLDRRLDAATGQRMQLRSVILPRWYRRSPR